MSPEVSVVLVSYNCGRDLVVCLDDLAREAERIPLEAIVIDNCSADDSAQACRLNHPWVELIVNRANLGFARAVNQGLKRARGRFFMLLNPDTRLVPGALSEMAAFLGDHPRAGAVGPKILDFDGSIQLSARRTQTPLAFLFNRYSLLTQLWPSNPLSRRYLLSDWDHDSPREVDWLSAAALMVRREAVERAGLMDEGFFLFHEDVDWCRRIGQAGFGIFFWPRAQVVHRIGISKERSSPRLIAIRHRSMIHYVHKHYAGLGPLLWLADLAIALRFGLLAGLGMMRRRN